MTPNPDIYSSPDVFQPPSSGGLEQPLFQDVRGTIQRLEIEGVKVNVLFTHTGFMRSGDLHKVPQYDAIISGKCCLWLRVDGQDIKTVYSAGDMIMIPPHTPHLFEFLEDTLMAEWWDGPFEAWYYRPYREIIDRQFKLATGTT